MDRNLGALDDRYHEEGDRKSKFFEFGRKDPFSYSTYVWTYDHETFNPTKSKTVDGGLKTITRVMLDEPGGDYNTGGHNVPFSVGHPDVYINGQSFTGARTPSAETAYCFDDIFNPWPYVSSIIWGDPVRGQRVENEEISSSVDGNKSFFDPCPSGWRIPVNGWVNGFRGDANGSATGDPNMNFQWGVDSEFKNRGSGRTYVPLGYLSQKGNSNAQTVFFPSEGGFFSCNPGSCYEACVFTFDRSSFSASTKNGTRGTKRNIRCLKQ